MKRLLLVLCALALPLPVAAQSIYGSPQKAAYASPAEYPTFSGQCHWLAPNVNSTPGIPSHVHVDMTFPLYGVTLADRAPFQVRFSLTLFHTAGRISRLDGMRLTGVTLDNGATFPLVGDPAGVKTWTGTATFSPTAISAQPLRGWMAYSLLATTRYTNGDVLYTQLRLPRYSMVDPSAPETGSGNIANTVCQVEDKSDTLAGRWGHQFTEFDRQVLPVLGTVSPELPWAPRSILYNYAPPPGGLPERGIAELWLDPDLHNGNSGTLLQRVLGAANSVSFAAITQSLPGGIPDGPHKLLYMWRRPHGAKVLVSNFVYTIMVGPGGVAPPSGTVLPPPPLPGPDPCVADPMTAVINFPADPNVTKAVITQVGRICPPIEVLR